MSVIVGSARINEFGELEGGQPGDQNGKEVSTQEWYLHNKGWYVIRSIDPVARLKIAQDMRYICANDNIGYSYWDSAYGLLNASRTYGYDASKVKVKVNTNCAKAVRTCILYAGIAVDDFSTADEVDKCEKTGKFIILRDDMYCKYPSYLLEGDILVTKTKGHTVVVLNDGPLATSYIPYCIVDCAYCNLRKGPSINYEVLDVLKVGVTVELFGWDQNGWGKVRYGDKIGYVSPIYLREYPRATVVGDTWLRDKAGRTVGKQIVVIPKGTILHLTKNTEMVGKTEWFEVIYRGQTGWSSGLYVKPN